MNKLIIVISTMLDDFRSNFGRIKFKSKTISNFKSKTGYQFQSKFLTAVSFVAFGRKIENVTKLLLAMGLLVSGVVQSAYGNVAAHVHGEAELTVLFDKDVLKIELITPAADIVGFERKAKNQKENAQLKSVNAVLSQNDSLFLLPRDKCKLTSFKSNLDSLLYKASNAHSKNHDHDHEKHDHGHDHHEKHKHNKDKAHDHSAEKHHKSHGSHREINISQEFYCRYSETIEEINVSIFKTFPSVKKIKVIWERGESFGAKVLTPNKSKIVLGK